MNLLQLRTDTRRLIAEASATASYSTDADLNAFINEGIKDMCVKGKVYEKTEYATFSTGTASYLLPLDFLTLRAIYNPSGVALDAMDPSGLGKVYVVAGKPTYYYISQTALTITTRQNSHAYVKGDIVTPISANGYMYEVTPLSGNSDSSPPTYPTNPGSRVQDGSIYLVCRDASTTGYKVVLVDTPTTAGGGTGIYHIIFYALDEGLYTDTDSPNFPEDKHHIIPIFATFRHFVRMKDATRAVAIYNDYAMSLGLKQQEPEKGVA